MIVLHFSIFFIYTIKCSPDETHGIQNQLQLQIHKFKHSYSDVNNYDSDRNINNKEDRIIDPSNNQRGVRKYEPNYPQQTRIHNFPTYASQQETAKHDRYIIHGIMYTEMLSKEYLKKHWVIPDTSKNYAPWKFQRKVCININMKNRSIPYINSLLMTLMSSHSDGEKPGNMHKWVNGGARLLAFADLNLLDTERNDRNYDDLRRKIMDLDFLHLHRVMGSSGFFYVRSRRLEQIENALASAIICVGSGLPWCLMMEEFTVVPKNFLDSLKRFVIAPLESYITTHRFEDGDSERIPMNDGEIIKHKMSGISLFSAYNSDAGDLMKIQDVKYSRSKYQDDRAKLDSERKSLDLEKYSYQYEMYPIYENDKNGADGGYDSAMLFHSSMVKNDMIPMLEDLLAAEKQKSSKFRFTTSNHRSNEENPIDRLDLEKEFSIYTNVKRYRVEPSLVNRIGFYDEQFDSGHRKEADLGITNWLTDPRFLFEPGPYSEGSDEYCEMSSGEWIWDALNKDSERSCCNENEAEAKECVDEYL